VAYLELEIELGAASLVASHKEDFSSMGNVFYEDWERQHLPSLEWRLHHNHKIIIIM